jgi:hypothetical protein
MYLGRFGRKRFDFRTTTSMHICARNQVAKLMFFAVAAKSFVALGTIERTVSAECLIALVTSDHIIALKTGRLVTLFTAESVFTLTTKFRRALLTEVEIIAVNADECLVALATDGHVLAVVADLLVALLTDEPIFALKTEVLVTLLTVETVFTLATEYCLTHSAKVELVAFVAECLVAHGT